MPPMESALREAVALVLYGAAPPLLAAAVVGLLLEALLGRLGAADKGAIALARGTVALLVLGLMGPGLLERLVRLCARLLAPYP